MLVRLSDNEDDTDNIEVSEEEAKLSLNAINKASKLSTMRLKTWIGKHEVSLLVDSRSTHNFVNIDILRKLGLRGKAIERLRSRWLMKTSLIVRS